MMMIMVIMTDERLSIMVMIMLMMITVMMGMVMVLISKDDMGKEQWLESKV